MPNGMGMPFTHAAGAQGYVPLVMHSAHTIDPTTRQAVHAFIERVASQYPLKEVILFGSRARGEAPPDSDADVAIVLDDPQGAFIQTKLDMADIAFDVLLETGIHIQPLPIWNGEWRQPDTWLNPELLHNIARTGISLWQAPPN